MSSIAGRCFAAFAGARICSYTQMQVCDTTLQPVQIDRLTPMPKTTTSGALQYRTAPHGTATQRNTPDPSFF